MASGCSLRIVRQGGYADRLRSYRILVNGAEAGTIAANSVLEINVPGGQTTIEARIDWAGSRPLTIQATAGGHIEIEVTNTYGAWAALWTITFGRKNYLVLRMTTASTA
jgi:hypothetical protein